MSVIDDSRALFQDVVTPDLKAIASRLDALEKSVKQGFESVEKVAELRQELLLNRLEAERAANIARHELVMNKLDQRTADLTSKLDRQNVDLTGRLDRDTGDLNAKYSALGAQIDREAVAAKERHESLLRSLDIDRRIELLESRPTTSRTRASERKMPHAKTA
jgi:hypothetical protein